MADFTKNMSQIKKLYINIKYNKNILIYKKIGDGESGKSTIIKQMKIIYKNGFKNNEMDLYTKVIYSNMVEVVQLILINFDSSNEDEDPKFKEAKSEVLELQNYYDNLI